MYYGPRSLVPNTRPAQNTNGVKLGIKIVTEASVAAAAILVRRNHITPYLSSYAKLPDALRPIF